MFTIVECFKPHSKSTTCVLKARVDQELTYTSPVSGVTAVMDVDTVVEVAVALPGKFPFSLHGYDIIPSDPLKEYTPLYIVVNGTKDCVLTHNRFRTNLSVSFDSEYEAVLHALSALLSNCANGEMFNGYTQSPAYPGNIRWAQSLGISLSKNGTALAPERW